MKIKLSVVAALAFSSMAVANIANAENNMSAQYNKMNNQHHRGGKMMHRLMKADVNHDKIITHDEFINMAMQKMEEVFARLDKDKNGQIDENDRKMAGKSRNRTF